jgi:predicted dehydrogenase
VHLIDLVQFLTEPGRAKRASGHCSSLFGGDSYVYDDMWSEPHPGGVFDVEDSIRATVHFASGLRLDLDVAWATHLPEGVVSDGIVLQGDLGAMSLDIWGDELLLGWAEEGRPERRVESIDVSDAWDDAFVGEHRAFAEAIDTRQQPVAGGEAGRSVQAIVEAIYESDRRKKEVAIVN